MTRSVGHRFDYDTPIEETVSAAHAPVREGGYSGAAGYVPDASSSRRRKSWICALHRHELLLGLPMYVIMLLSYSLFRLTLT